MPSPFEAPYVVVTRPSPGLEATCRLVRQQGWRALAHPMLSITPLFPRLPHRAFDALVLTSGQAVQALDRVSRDIAVYAVGAATAQKLRDAGFLHVRTCGGTSKALLMERALLQGRRRILFPTGEGLGLALTRDLMAQGHVVTRLPTYRSQPVTELSPTLIETLRNHVVSAVLFFSARTAGAWTLAASRHQLPTRTYRAISLSDQVARQLDVNAWSRMVVARSPDQSAMLDALGTPGRDAGQNLP